MPYNLDYYVPLPPRRPPSEAFTARDATPKNLLIAGILVIALCGIGVIFLRRPAAKAAGKDGATQSKQKG